MPDRGTESALVRVAKPLDCTRLFLRCLRPLDEHVNVKLLLRLWGPRFEVLVRLILVATFLDDSVRVALHFADHMEQVGEQGYLKPLAAKSPELLDAIAGVVLCVGLLVQSLGSVCLLALIQPDVAIKAMIAWAIAHPVLYAQLANVGFVAESFSLVGGLLILRAHLAEQARREDRHVPLGGGALCGASDDPEASTEATIARTQLLGRLLLLTVYLYHTGLTLLSYRDAVEQHSLSMFVFNTAVLAFLVLGCTLVATGLRSRTVALSLALVNLGYVCYSHPFFSFVSFPGGEWKYDEERLKRSMPNVAVALPKDISPYDFEPWLIFDLHRYYFFQGLSTSGALLLLAQFGPGEIALEEDEVLLGDMQLTRACD